MRALIRWRLCTDSWHTSRRPFWTVLQSQENRSAFQTETRQHVYSAPSITVDNALVSFVNTFCYLARPRVYIAAGPSTIKFQPIWPILLPPFGRLQKALLGQSWSSSRHQSSDIPWSRDHQSVVWQWDMTMTYDNTHTFVLSTTQSIHR